MFTLIAEYEILITQRTDKTDLILTPQSSQRKIERILQIDEFDDLANFF